ncbi:MAG TPA: hypothetical protein VFI25_17785 [Planctomycetota bacterium]|nr:hypothetical protein [Planctomycetota bacterium]
MTATLRTITRAEYRDLLRDLARIQAARLVPNPPAGSLWISSADFWASIRVARGECVRFEDEWCGYPCTENEIKSARSEAAVERVWRSLRGSEAKPRAPIQEERLWAARRFGRDWKRLQEPSLDDYWWVRERYPSLMAAVGDDSAFPLLHSLTVVRVRVLGADGSPLPYGSVKVRGIRSKQLRESSGEALPRPGDPTAFVLIGEPGNDELEVRGAGFPERRVPVSVGPKTPQEVVVRFGRETEPR